MGTSTGSPSSDRLSVPGKDANPPDALELSVVIPCLNEEDTLAACIRKAQNALKEHGVKGEVVVADNGSTDDSVAIAQALQARVVHVEERGYGSALMGGIAAARGRYVIMGDADDSYDFTDIPRFLARLREGRELVQGCRLPSGGGVVLPGAMKFTHRWIGNPLFSLMARIMFAAPIHDVYCGMRGFSRELYDRLGLRCTGMEFATEMIIKASIFKADIVEVPITLHPDGRKTQGSHLRTLRDGWRTLQFFMCFSPRWLFLLPGLLLFVLGLAGYGLALPGVTIAGATLDAHTLLVASMALLLGAQCAMFALFAKTFAVNEGLMPSDPFAERLFRVFRLERGILAGLTMTATGVLLLASTVDRWYLAGFGPLDYPRTMRVVIPAVTLVVLGFQTVMASFFLGVLRLKRK